MIAVAIVAMVFAQFLTPLGAPGNWIMVAILGVVAPFLLGFGLMGPLLGHPQVASIFVGAAMVATSVGMSSPGKGLAGGAVSSSCPRVGAHNFCPASEVANPGMHLGLAHEFLF